MKIPKGSPRCEDTWRLTPARRDLGAYPGVKIPRAYPGVKRLRAYPSVERPRAYPGVKIPRAYPSVKRPRGLPRCEDTHFAAAEPSAMKAR